MCSKIIHGDHLATQDHLQTRSSYLYWFHWKRRLVMYVRHILFIWKLNNFCYFWIFPSVPLGGSAISQSLPLRPSSCPPFLTIMQTIKSYVPEWYMQQLMFVILAWSLWTNTTLHSFPILITRRTWHPYMTFAWMLPGAIKSSNVCAFQGRHDVTGLHCDASIRIHYIDSSSHQSIDSAAI